jgi:hypothetical protein
VPRCGALNLLQKTPNYRGDPEETAARLHLKLRVLVVVPGGAWWDLTPYSTRNLKAATRKLKADEERAHSRGIRSCWFVLLYFAPCRPLPRPRRPYCIFVQNKKTGVLVPFEPLDTHSNKKISSLLLSARRALCNRPIRL